MTFFFQSSEQKLIQSICDESLLEILAHLQVECIVAVGRFAEKRVVSALKNINADIKVIFLYKTESKLKW